ncbi:Mechanosensitive ion channel-domain-containing protein [Hypoxylon cercidicola]|nr:Mechanosensitive ion channel-domain-containing protein [Hypoxylon cercidicola]
MDNEIPLTQVRSNASSTGARKPNQGTATGFSSTDYQTSSENEKRSFFHRGRRRAKNAEASKDNDNLTSEGASLNAMGRLYNSIIHASVVTRYLVYIVPVALLLAVPLIVIPATGNKDRILVGKGPRTNPEAETPAVFAPGPRLFDLFLWIELTWLSLWVGKIVAHLLPPIFMFFTGVVSAGTRKYAIVIRALEIPLSLFFWALADFFIFTGLINVRYNDVDWVISIRRIVGALFASSAVFLGEKAIIQLISVTYHQRSFANRIKDSKREVHLLGLMYDASRQLFPMYCPEFVEEDQLINDSIELMLAGGKKSRRNRKSGAVTPMKLIGNVTRIGDKVTSVFGNLASEITGKQVFNPNSAHSIVVEALEKVRTSEALAKRIWMSFVVEGNEALFVDDIIEVLGPAHRDDAEECFGAIDADGNGDISLDEMIRKIVEIGKERKAIVNSMKDISQALAVFDQVLLFIVLLIVIFIFLAFFQSSFITTLATAGTALLSLSFVFAVTTQEFLGSCIFLFVKHPYDVGDRVDCSGEQLVVEKISLLYTVFNRIDRMQVVQVPNIVLNNLWIENVSRSKAMKEVIDVNVSFDTSFEDIELLRLEMEKFVRAPENARDFQPDLTIGVGSVGDLDKLTLKVAIKHKSNWHNDAVRATRRSKFMCALALALKRVPIYGPGGGGEPLGGPTNPAYSVAVSDADAIAARGKADQDKEAKRMVPAAPPARNPSTSNKSGIPEVVEARAAQGLNTLNPARTAAEDWGFNRGDDGDLDEAQSQPMDRKRSNDIESIRLELHKRESQRSGGRRRAGETLPSQPISENTPSFQITQHSGPFDEEAQIGGPSPYGNTQPGNSLYPQSSNRTNPSNSSNSQRARAPSQPYDQR